MVAVDGLKQPPYRAWEEYLRFYFDSLKQLNVKPTETDLETLLGMCMRRGRTGLPIELITDLMNSLVSMRIPLRVPKPVPGRSPGEQVTLPKVLHRAIMTLTERHGLHGINAARALLRRLPDFYTDPPGVTLRADTFAYNVMLACAARYDGLNEATALWDEMTRRRQPRTGLSYAVFLRSLVSKPNGDMTRALSVISDMHAEGVTVSADNWARLSAFIEIGHSSIAAAQSVIDTLATAMWPNGDIPTFERKAPPPATTAAAAM